MKSFDALVYDAFMASSIPLNIDDLETIFPDVDRVALVTAVTDLMRLDVVEWVYPYGKIPEPENKRDLLLLRLNQ